jgi:hypothetical protein
MPTLTDDPWIKSNSEIQAEKLHAIGVVSFQWSHCEFWLFYLFCEVSKLPEEIAWSLIYDLGDVSICIRIKTLLPARNLHSDAVALIENALECYDRCRQNRNSIIHAWAIGRGFHSQMARTIKKPEKLELVPFPCELDDIRNVAEEIQWLSRRLWLMCCHLEDGSAERAMPSPGILPLPDFLWKSPYQGHTGR